MNTRKYTIASIVLDEEGFATAILNDGGVLSDHPYWEGIEGSHYLVGLSDMAVGDTVED